MDSNRSCDFIRSASECELAAGFLGLSDTSVASVSIDYGPPYCYYKAANSLDEKLFFNTHVSKPFF